VSKNFGLDKHHAIVLSGGGANAAYEAGVVRALTAGACGVTGYQPLEPAIYTGTSSGAFNAAILTSWSDYPAAAAAEYLEQLWLNQVAWGPGRCGNGFFRIRGDPRRLFDPGCDVDRADEAVETLEDALHLSRDIFRHAGQFVGAGGSLGRRTLSLVDLSMFISRGPLKHLLDGALRPAVIRDSSKVLRIAVTEWTRGELRIFHNQDMTDEAAVFIVLASAAIPGFFQPVELGSEVYVDGGVVMDTPLLPAIQAGAEVVHVIYPDPEVANIPLEAIRSTYGSFDRTLLIGKARVINQDIDTARRINEGLDLLERFRTAGFPETVERRAVLAAARSIGQARAPEVAYKRLLIHRYHPCEDFGGIAGVLNADNERIRSLIEKGREDAVNHNCMQAGCLL